VAGLLFLFIVVPFVELFLLMRLAEWFGTLPTFGLVIFTGIVGAALARHQGFRTLRQIQSELSDGHMPTRALIDAGMILVAGALLVTPGVLTDVLGFSLLIPICRQAYRAVIAAYIQRNFTITQMDVESFRPSSDRVVDAEVLTETVVDADSKCVDPRSP